MVELREVASDASALAAELAKANRLPLDFPAERLLELLAELQSLPAGTAEGCRQPLECARARLPAIRRRFIQTEGQSRQPRADEESPPPLTRGMTIDVRIGALVNSVTTALDEYRALASVQDDDAATTAPSLEIDATLPDAVNAMTASRSVERTLAEHVEELERIAEPQSPAERQAREKAEELLAKFEANHLVRSFIRAISQRILPHPDEPYKMREGTFFIRRAPIKGEVYLVEEEKKIISIADFVSAAVIFANSGLTEELVERDNPEYTHITMRKAAMACKSAADHYGLSVKVVADTLAKLRDKLEHLSEQYEALQDRDFAALPQDEQVKMAAQARNAFHGLQKLRANPERLSRDPLRVAERVLKTNSRKRTPEP